MAIYHKPLLLHNEMGHKVKLLTLLLGHPDVDVEYVKGHPKYCLSKVCVQGATAVFVVGLIILLISISVTTACVKRTGAAASVERRRREPARAISPE